MSSMKKVEKNYSPIRFSKSAKVFITDNNNSFGKRTLEGVIAPCLQFTRFVKCGEMNYYYRDGSLRLRQHYKDGVPHGTQEFFSRKGEPIWKFNYVEGVAEGVQESWSGGDKTIYIFKNGEEVEENKIERLEEEIELLKSKLRKEISKSRDLFERAA
jgi:antitoxin component YwqK of YwqJK toxin-antitoxin module